MLCCLPKDSNTWVCHNRTTFIQTYIHTHILKYKPRILLNPEYITFLTFINNVHFLSFYIRYKWMDFSNVRVKYIGSKYLKFITFITVLSLKGYRFRRCNFVEVFTSLWGIHCIKNQKVEFLQNTSDLTILNDILWN